MKLLAQIVSWVFLPILMPIYALLITMYIPSMEDGFYQDKTIYFLHPSLKLAVLGMFALFSFFAPAISLVLLKRSNLISNLEIDNQNERSIPILITALYCGVLAWFLIAKTPKGMLPLSIPLLPIGAFIAILTTAIINRFDKISLHALGIGMFFGFLIAYYQSQVLFPLFIVIISALLSGLILSSRMYLGKHTLKQSLMGYALGFIVLYIAIHFFA
jgi:membrane-associated phospholipid phosphatase